MAGHADLRKTKYPVINNVVKSLGLTPVGNEKERVKTDPFEEIWIEKDEDFLFDSLAEKAVVIWSDQYVPHKFIRFMSPKQKVNHFPGSNSLGRKNLLYQSYLRMKSACPDDFNYLPGTWLFPLQIQTIRKMAEKTNQPKGSLGEKQYFIVKPEASCQGKGIFLTKNIKKLLRRQNNFVIQEYIARPMLIGGLKFDIRLYVLVSCLNPLQVFLYKEGLVRFCTEKYKAPSKENHRNMFIHLTNYAVNKTNTSFVPTNTLAEEGKAHKRSFSSLLNVPLIF